MFVNSTLSRPNFNEIIIKGLHNRVAARRPFTESVRNHADPAADRDIRSTFDRADKNSSRRGETPGAELCAAKYYGKRGSRLSRSRCITVSRGNVSTESFYMWGIKEHRATNAKYICFVNDIARTFATSMVSHTKVYEERGIP